MISFEQYIDEIKKEKGKSFLKIVRKQDSLLMKILHWITVIISFGSNKNFQKRFITTLGHTIYTPEDWDFYSDNSKITHAQHEMVHMEQMKKYTTLGFYFLYLFIPFPIFFAYFRKKFECEGYEKTMRLNASFVGMHIFDDPLYKHSIINHFVSSEYMWCWYSKKDIEKWYLETVEKIKKEMEE